MSSIATMGVALRTCPLSKKWCCSLCSSQHRCRCRRGSMQSVVPWREKQPIAIGPARTEHAPAFFSKAPVVVQVEFDLLFPSNHSAAHLTNFRNMGRSQLRIRFCPWLSAVQRKVSQWSSIPPRNLISTPGLIFTSRPLPNTNEVNVFRGYFKPTATSCHTTNHMHPNFRHMPRYSLSPILRPSSASVKFALFIWEGQAIRCPVG